MMRLWLCRSHPAPFPGLLHEGLCCHFPSFLCKNAWENPRMLELCIFASAVKKVCMTPDHSSSVCVQGCCAKRNNKGVWRRGNYLDSNYTCHFGAEVTSSERQRWTVGLECCMTKNRLKSTNLEQGKVLGLYLGSFVCRGFANCLSAGVSKTYRRYGFTVHPDYS